jgi:protein-S-isoprenylcysteine O-methyltransferase Ste14
MYSAFLLLFAGLSLLTSNLVLAAILLGSQVWVLAWRLGAEESQLAERFGDQWHDYRRRTGALFPRLR